MKTIIQEIQVYQFEELSTEAQSTAREWIYRYGYPWQDEGCESIKKALELFGVTVKNIEYSGYPQIDCSTSAIDDDYLSLSGEDLKKELQRILPAEPTDLTGYCFDYCLQPAYDYLKNPDGATMEDIIFRVIDAAKESIKADVEDAESLEYVTDHCHANGYEFTADGKLFKQE